MADTPPPIGGNHTIRTATRRLHADRQLLMLPNPHRCRCGGRRRDRRVRAAVPEGPWDLPRYPWVAAGPGRGAGRRRQDQGGPRDEANRPQHNRPHWCGGRRRDRRARLRCPWAAAGPGCGARGRRRGQAAVLVGGGRARAGLEIDHSERSSRVAISRAGRRRPAHTAARPIKAGHATVENQPGPPAPGSPVGPQASKVGSRRRPAHTAARPRHAETPPRRCGTGFSLPSRV